MTNDENCLPIADIIHMKFQGLFSQKKKIIGMPFATILIVSLRVNAWINMTTGKNLGKKYPKVSSFKVADTRDRQNNTSELYSVALDSIKWLIYSFLAFIHFISEKFNSLGFLNLMHYWLW